MRVGAAQFHIPRQDPAANLATVSEFAVAAAAQGVDLLVVPEMFTTGFCTESAEIAEPEAGAATVAALSALAAQHAMVIIGSVAVDVGGAAPTARNRLVVVGPDGLLAHYDKRHPFSFAGEHLQFGAGDEVVTVEVGGVRVTPFVCYDLRFADGFWAAAPTTDLFVVPANWPAARAEHWRTLLRARAIENQAFVVGVNRVGDAQGLAHRGDSCVVDPTGEVLVAAAADAALLVADVTAARVVEVRAGFPVLADRRPR